jgi:secreted PhoX family phosphatase
LDYPDNLTVSPNGCVLICEDGGRDGQMLMGLSSGGELFPLVRNAVELNGEYKGLSGNYRGSEWCGACFSPDGQWLFANIQKPGITVAITGPWQQGKV